MHTIEMQWASSTVSPDHFIMRVVEGTVLEPLTTPENYTVGTGGFVWAYPGISDEVWEREVRPVIDRRIWKLEDRLKIMSGRST